MTVTLGELQSKSREIWGDHKMPLKDIVTSFGVVYGDICRLARDQCRRSNDIDELKKELGNVILSTIRWTDDLGLDLNECITLAIEAQIRFVKNNKHWYSSGGNQVMTFWGRGQSGKCFAFSDDPPIEEWGDSPGEAYAKLSLALDRQGLRATPPLEWIGEGMASFRQWKEEQK